MGCRLIKNNKGEVKGVFQKDGSPSVLYDYINDNIKNSNVALGAYLSMAVNKEQDPSVMEADAVITDAIMNPAKYEEYVLEADLETAETDLHEKISRFLDDLGISVEVVDEITNEKGEKLNAVAKANLIKKVIQITETGNLKMLSEESAHFLVEILRETKSPLYDSLYNNIVHYSIYQEITNPESVVYKNYSGNEDLLRREAMAKVIAAHIVGDRPAQTKEEKSWIERLQRWIQKVLAFFKGQYTVTGNPSREASQLLLENSLEEYLNMEGLLSSPLKHMRLNEAQDFYQESVDPQQNIMEKLVQNDKYEIDPQLEVGDNKYYQRIAQTNREGTQYIARYVHKETGEPLEVRITDAVSLEYQRRYRPRYNTPEEKEYFEKLAKIKSEGGTRIHNALDRMMKMYLKKNKDTAVAIQQEYGLTTAQYNLLFSNVKSIVSHILKVQKEIDPKGKPQILNEQFIKGQINILGQARDAGGTIDILVIFSDGSAAIYDYKSKTPSITKDQAYYTKKGKFVLKKDPFADSIDQYDTQLSLYKEVLTKYHGVTKVRESRIIPIVVNYKKEDGGPTGIIQDLQMGGEFLGFRPENPFLDPIPVAGEKTDIESIDKLIVAEQRRLIVLKDKIKDATYKTKMAIQEDIKRSQNIIRKLTLEQDVKAGITEGYRILKKLEKGLKENLSTKDDGSLNPYYLTNEELLEGYNDLKHFITFLEFLEDDINLIAKKLGKSKDWAKNLKDEIKKAGKYNSTLGAVKHKLIERGQDFASSKGVQGLKSFNRTVDAITANVTNLSTHSNPFQRTIYETLNEINTHITRISKDLATEVEEKESALLEWGERNGYRGPAVYDLLINPDTNNLYPKYSQQLWEEKEEALKNRNLNFFKENYELDEEKFNKEYDERKKYVFKVIEDKHTTPEGRRKAKESWVKKNNPKLHSEAWFNPAMTTSKGFLKLKAESENKYISSEYRRIQATPELKDFYNFHRKMSLKFTNIMGIDRGAGWIANIHKDIIDTWVEDGMNMSTMTQAALDTLQIREHDFSTIGVTDLDGNLVRRVPKLYTRELYNANGEIDSSLKSRDLGKSLYLLGMAAYQYKFHQEAVPSLLLLETLLKDNIVGGIRETQGGNVDIIAGNTVNILKSSNAETFTDTLDHTIFGRGLKSKGKTFKMFGKTFSADKTILGLKQWHTTATLGLRAPVAIGAWGAGMVGLQIQASKGLFFTQKELIAAEKSFMARDPKLRAVLEYFDISLEDLKSRRGDLLSASFRGKYMNSDRWFELLARADKSIDAILASAMAQSHGINPKTGKVERLKDLPKGTKSLWDSLEVKENPKYKVGGVHDKYIVTLPGVSRVTLTKKMTKEQKAKAKEQNILANRAYGLFKAKVHNISRSVKGTMSPDDTMLFNYKMYGKLFLHYRSWLPGIAFERFGRLRYDYIMDHYDQGTWRSFWGNIGKDKAFDTAQQALDTEVALHEHLLASLGDLSKIALDISTFGFTNQYTVKEGRAKAEFDRFILDQSGNPEFENLVKGDAAYEAQYEKFLELKRANIRGALSELRYVILMMLGLMAIGGDWDDDGQIDIRRTYAGRKMHNLLNRVYREVAFFLAPNEFSGPRATGIPLMGMVQNASKWTANSLDELRDAAFGEESERDRTPFMYYTFKFIPGINALGKLVELFPQEKYARV